MIRLTLENVAEAMLGDGLSFKDVYYPELQDCLDDVVTLLGKTGPNGITKQKMKENGYKNISDCLREGPSKEGFGRIALEAWIKFFFEYPDLMELVGIIAEQENPEADPEVIQEMKSLKSGALIIKSEKRGVLTGMKVVFTGASKYFKGENMERFLEKNGASTSHAVKSGTELLITGERPSKNKIGAAKMLGVRIITEDDFIKEFKDQLIGLPK